MEKQFEQLQTKEKEASSEKLFRYVTIVLVMGLLYCVPGFLSFKDLATSQGYHFVKSESWWWCLVGFVVYGVTILSLSPLNTRTFLSPRTLYSVSSIPNFREMKDFIE